MKTNMKTKLKTILLSVILFMGMIGSAFAQTQASITSSATIMTDIVITANQNIQFGNVAVSETPILNALTGTHTDVGSTAQLGKLTVTGSGGGTVNVSWSNNNLTYNSKNLTFAPSVYRTANSSLNHGETNVPTSGGGYTINNSTDNSGTVGADYFWVGGTLTTGTLTDNPAGTYTGTFTLTVEYN